MSRAMRWSSRIVCVCVGGGLQRKKLLIRRCTLDVKGGTKPHTVALVGEGRQGSLAFQVAAACRCQSGISSDTELRSLISLAMRGGALAWANTRARSSDGTIEAGWAHPGAQFPKSGPDINPTRGLCLARHTVPHSTVAFSSPQLAVHTHSHLLATWSCVLNPIEPPLHRAPSTPVNDLVLLIRSLIDRLVCTCQPVLPPAATHHQRPVTRRHRRLVV
jgi:hypothetical protein